MIETKDIAARAERYRRLWESVEGTIPTDAPRWAPPLRAIHQLRCEQLAAHDAELWRRIEAAGLRGGWWV